MLRRPHGVRPTEPGPGPTIGSMSDPEPETRIERDSMGEMPVPADALYGASTQRAVLNFPISGQRVPARVHPCPGAGQAGGRRDERRARPARAGRRAGHRGGGRGGGGRRPRRAVPDRYLPDGIGHLDQHEHERGRRAPRREAAGRGPQRPPERPRQSLPELERRDPDRAPALGGDGDRGGAAARRSSSCRPRSPRRPTSSGRWSRPGARTSRTRRRSGWARSSGATPDRSRRRCGGPWPPRPSCCPCRSGARRSGPASTPIPSSRRGPASAWPS